MNALHRMERFLDQHMIPFDSWRIRTPRPAPKPRARRG